MRTCVGLAWMRPNRPIRWVGWQAWGGLRRLGDKGWMQAGWLAENALDLIQADLIIAAVVELGGAGRGGVGDHRRLLQSAAVLEVSGDAGRPVSDFRADPHRPAPPHIVGAALH